MTEFQVKQAALKRGFNARINQLMDREVSARMMEKQSMQFLRGLGTAAMDVGKALPGALRGVAKASPQMEFAVPGMEAAAKGFGGRLWEGIPGASQEFLQGNKSMLTGMGAGAAGFAGAKGFDAYEDSRRREMIRRLGIMPRLMLAGQMLFSPEKAMQSMRL